MTGVALSYVIDSDRRLLTITGEYADAVEWNRLLTAVLDDPALRPGFAFLRDLRGATNPVEPATVVGIVDVVRRFWPKLQATRAAILTPRDVDPAALWLTRSPTRSTCRYRCFARTKKPSPGSTGTPIVVRSTRARVQKERKPITLQIACLDAFWEDAAAVLPAVARPRVRPIRRGTPRRSMW